MQAFLVKRTNVAATGKRGLFVRPSLWLYGVASTLILVAVAATVAWLGPLPPKVVVMSTGTAGSDLDFYAQQYQTILNRSGVDLRLLPSSGSVDNLRRLNDRHSGVAVAFVQGGLTDKAQSPDLESLGTMFYEPFWFFARHDISANRLEDLGGKKVAIGSVGSGTRVLAKQFFALNELDESHLQLLALTDAQAADALLHGAIDAAAMVASWDTPLVRRLLASSDVNLVGFPRAEAYVAFYPYLTRLVLPMGVGNLATNRPATDVNLVAPKVSLVVREDLHPAIKYLLLEAATEIHSEEGLFRKSGQFPAPEPVGLPISKDARQFYKSGSPFLQRYLPAGLAVLASRFLVLLIPVVGIAYPLLRAVPAVYGWSMRRRIFRLYGQLKLIEVELEAGSGPAFDDLLTQLQRLEDRADHLHVPSTFAHFLYHLRNHIALVRGRIQQAASLSAESLSDGSHPASEMSFHPSSKACAARIGHSLSRGGDANLKP